MVPCLDYTFLLLFAALWRANKLQHVNPFQEHLINKRVSLDMLGFLLL
jgi:hypothetical protein